MSIPGSIPVAESRSTFAADLGRCALWVVWQCIRLPLFLFLLVLEPVVTFVLGALALLGVLTALFWKFFGPPDFPFFLMLGISLGFELAVIGYRKLLRFLCSRARRARWPRSGGEGRARAAVSQPHVLPGRLSTRPTKIASTAGFKLS